MNNNEAYNILLQNGMFRNRDPPNLAKPISGSNVDTADIPGEIVAHIQAMLAWHSTGGDR